MCGKVLNLPVEEVEPALLALRCESARTDDVFKLLPIPAGAALLLLHIYNTLINNMSQISAYKKVHPSWKISDNSRVYPAEVSIRDPKSILPEKFSPAKTPITPSKIFTASKEKLNLVRGGKSPREANVTPSKGERISMASNISLKESVPLLQSTQRMRPIAEIQLQSHESLALHNMDSDSPSPKRKGAQESQYQVLKAQQEFNLNAIHQLRIDFITFKSQVLAQLVEQRDNIARIAAEMSAKMDRWRMHQGNKVPIAYAKQEIGQNLTVVDLAKNVETVSSTLQRFSDHLQKKYSQLKLDCIEPSPPATPNQKKTMECRSPIDKLQSYAPEKRNTPLDKCNQIVQTIGILSEINASPVNSTAKSTEKLNIQEYKQKLIAVSRSNEQLIREGQRNSLKRQQGEKLKGNFKLDKFYNAIQKLKEEVNEIRNINDMKQTKKLKILKTQQ